MKTDVIDALSGRFPKRIPSKETLNHPELIRRVAGVDVFEDTPRAYETAWRKLGIDVHPPLPRGNAPRPRVPGGTWEEGNLRYADLGVYPTSMPKEHCPELDKSDPDWIYRYDPAGDGFLADEESVPEEALHPSFREGGGAHGEGRMGRREALFEMSRDFRNGFGDAAVMYHLYYTTLFMWPVVTFGWEDFLTAAGTDPERFDAHFWEPWSRVSREYFETIAGTDDEVVFTHDDLTTSTGPMFRPDFYERYIFPKYEAIFAPAAKAGKKIVFVCDGNMDVFLERLLEFPIAAIMFENPATPFDRVLETWGKAGRGFIGGIETAILVNGTPDQVRRHTRETIEKGREYPGFIIASCGGLHGDVPMANALAYFETRNEMGIAAEL